MLRIVNRVLLALTGVGLTALGAAVLAGAMDLPARLGITPPERWPWAAPDDVLLSRADRIQWREDGWWWPVVIGGLVVLVLLGVWWVLAQLRRQRLAEIVIDSGDGVGAVLQGEALEDAMTAEAEALPGVDRARVTLVGRRTEAQVRIGLLMAPQAHPGDVVRRLDDETLRHARTSAGLDSLPAEVRLRSAKHAAERVS